MRAEKTAASNLSSQSGNFDFPPRGARELRKTEPEAQREKGQGNVSKWFEDKNLEVITWVPQGLIS